MPHQFQWIGLILLPGLVGTPAEVFAAQCFSAPAQVADFSAPQPLSKSDRQLLKDFFKSLDGWWEGRAEGFFCEGSEDQPLPRPDDYRLAARIKTDINGDAELSARHVSEEKDSEHDERRRYFISEDYLRIHNNTRSGDVSIISIALGHVSFWENQLNRAPNGAVIRREIRQTITLHGDKLILEFAVYSHSRLISMSTWTLERE